MGFRRSLVRIQSPRHRKGWRNNELRRPLFLPPRAWVGNWIGNPGLTCRVVPERRTRAPPKESASVQKEQALGLPVETGELLMRPHHPWYWAAKNAWFVEIGDTRHNLGKHPENVPPPKKRKRGDPPPKPP